MADSDVDRLALAPKPDRAAQASAFVCHGIPSDLILRRRFFSAVSKDDEASGLSWFETPREDARLLTMRTH
jgi:hypothetical protein